MKQIIRSIIAGIWKAIPCGHICESVSPYGYVPEADCPIHDHRLLDKLTKDDPNYRPLHTAEEYQVLADMLSWETYLRYSMGNHPSQIGIGSDLDSVLWIEAGG